MASELYLCCLIRIGIEFTRYRVSRYHREILTPPPPPPPPQLITAATNGKAADVDRLIKDGANTEAKDAEVRSVTL